MWETTGSRAQASAEGGGAAVRTFGYARVSTREQNLDRQMAALIDFGVTPEMVFADKASGADFDRREYRRLVAQLSPGDVVVVKSIDRFGRDYDEILEEWRLVTRDIGADVVVLDMPLLDTRSGVDGVTGKLISDIALQLLSYVAQVEREGIRQRQAEGIAAARSRGVRFGRPRVQRPRGYLQAREDYLRGAVSQTVAAARLGVSVRTFVRWLAEDATG